MEKPLPKKVETQLVKEFLNETLDTKLGEFEERIDKRFDHIDQRFDRIDKRFTHVDQRLEVLERNGEFIGTLIKNTHQEVKHFMELHKVLDERVSKLEKEMSDLRHKVELLLEH